MNNLRDFVEYDGSKLSASHPVLVWSRATGYFFTTFGAVTADQKVSAMED